MFNFKKLCTKVESLSDKDRGILIISEAKKSLEGLAAISETSFNPTKALATFMIGAVVSDGKIDEKEYLLIYPSLVKAFGEDFDYQSVKRMLTEDKDGKKLLNDYINALIEIISEVDENLQTDIVTLCLLVVSIDGKVTPQERRYIRRLCK